MINVRVEKIKGANYQVICDQCLFYAAVASDNFTKSGYQNAVFDHVKQTGHSVTIETIRSTRYSFIRWGAH